LPECKAITTSTSAAKPTRTQTLADYDLSPEERAALTDPDKLADVFKLYTRQTCLVNGFVPR
jgi:hypothetical protein